MGLVPLKQRVLTGVAKRGSLVPRKIYPPWARFGPIMYPVGGQDFTITMTGPSVCSQVVFPYELQPGSYRMTYLTTGFGETRMDQYWDVELDDLRNPVIVHMWTPTDFPADQTREYMQFQLQATTLGDVFTPPPLPTYCAVNLSEVPV